MAKLRHIRGYILGAAILLLLLPTYIVLASPITAQSINTDFSWAKDLPPIIVVMIGVIVIISLLTWFFSKVILSQQNKVTLRTPEGEPDKTITVNEMTGIAFNKFLEFMERAETKNQLQFEEFSKLIRSFTDDANERTKQTNLALTQFKDELIEGRGNQISAIMEVRDQFVGAVSKMEDSRTNIAEKIERLNGGVGYLQMGQTKMQQNLESLLEETRKLTQSIAEIISRIEHIDESMGAVNEAELMVKSELSALTVLVHSLDDRLNKIALAAKTQDVIESGLTPDTPAPQVKETKNV